MKRRDFLAASGLVTAASLSRWSDAADMPADPKQYLELRQYTFASMDRQSQFDAFLAQAAIPALNKLGIKPVGVFKSDENTDLYVLIPHTSLATVTTANTRLLASTAYQQAGKAVLNSPMDDPIYTGLNSSLLLAFDQCPKVEVPSSVETRVFQMRIYQSHNTVKAKNKIEMFNRGGEIALFRKTGLTPVFFGESLVGTNLPNLTYMVGFDDTETQQKAWDTFVNTDEWKAMSRDPYYSDNVSKITNLQLRPAGSSQI
jgi:hypothetical protein